jgi:hypothetical protein
MQTLLERLYAKYNHRVFVPPDPLQFVYRYTDRRDVEIAAFLASALAYGRVRQIERSLTQLFDDYGSLESLFVLGYRREDATVLPALSRFCESLCQMHRGQVPAGLNYLLANPRRGSASKRLNLFLRWMVRCDEVDLGLWTRIDKARLIAPIDVHMGRLCRILGLHNDKTISLSTALKVTRAFAEMEPSDPAKYDFALSRIGILEDCTGRPRSACELCELRRICVKLAGHLESM